MKKLYYLFVVLLLSMNLPVNGQSPSNMNGLTEMKLTRMNLNKFMQSDYGSNKKALLEMKKVREMIMRSDNALFKTKALKQVNEQMSEILFGKKLSLVNVPLKSKANTVNWNVRKNHSRRQYSLFNQLKTRKTANDGSRRKVPADGVMKYRLDSLVFYEVKGQEWIPSEKQEFTYNFNTQPTLNYLHVYDTILVVWEDDEKTTMSYNEAGQMTQYYFQWWNNDLKRWIDEEMNTFEYNSNGDVVKVECYSEMYDESLLRFIKRGIYKRDYSYDDNSNDIGFIDYSWDDQEEAWIPNYKCEYLYQDDIELMYALYMWDQESQKWVGIWKFENEIIPFFEVQSSTNYDWDEQTDTWIVTHKTLYEVFPEATDTTVTETYWTFDSESETLVCDYKVVYSNFMTKAADLSSSFGNIDYYSWDAEQSEWVNDSKTTNTFDSYGNITHGYDSLWVNTGGEENEWMIQVSIEAHVNSAGFIADYLVTYWNYDGTTNEINRKVQYLNAYNEKNELIQQIKQEWDFNGQTWKNLTKEEYAYDELNNLIQQIWYDSFNSGTMVWNPDKKTELAYNADGSEALNANYEWDITLQDWRLTNKYEVYYDEYGMIVLEASTEWDDNLEREIINYKNEKVYDNQRNLNMESYIQSTVWYDGDQYYLDAEGEKFEYNYNPFGQLLSFIEYNYIDEVFVPYEKYEYTYHSAYPMAVEVEYVFTWNEAISTWENKSKGLLISNFEVPREDLVLPFQPLPGEDEAREVKMYFNYMLTELLQYAWSNTTQNWVEDSKVSPYYTQGEFSSVNQLDLEPFSVYPNPVNDFLTISLNNHLISTIRLFDLQGRKLLETPVFNQSKIDVTGLAKGIYLYQFTTDHETISGKLLKK